MTSPAPTTGGPPRAPKTPEHWNAWASVIAAAVSVLTFLLGFVGLPAAGVDSPVATSETVTATTTVTTTAAPEEPKPSDTSSGEQPNNSAPSAERWSGSLLFEQSDAFDLDLTPPSKEGDTDLSFYAANAETEAEFWYASMALLPQGKEADAKECAFLVRTQSKTDIDVPIGRSFCVTTTAGRSAIVTVKKLDANDGSVTVDVRVWEKES